VLRHSGAELAGTLPRNLCLSIHHISRIIVGGGDTDGGAERSADDCADGGADGDGDGQSSIPVKHIVTAPIVDTVGQQLGPPLLTQSDLPKTPLRSSRIEGIVSHFLNVAIIDEHTTVWAEPMY